MLRERFVKVIYKDRIYELEFTGCTVMPQQQAMLTAGLQNAGMPMTSRRITSFLISLLECNSN